jgi:hypothetical protein
MDAACAYLQAEDPTAAVRRSLDEIRCHHAARILITDIAQSGPAAAEMARLTTLTGLTL